MPSLALATVLFILPAGAYAQAPQSGATSAALAEINKGHLFEGIRQLKEIVRTEPSSASAQFYLSSLYTGIGRYEIAYRYLETALKLNPGQGAYYHQLGVIRYREGCRPEALTAFQQALRTGMGDDEVTVWMHMGDLYVDLLAWDKAIEAYEHALLLRPSHADAHLALGRLYLGRNDLDRAVLELRAALKTDPNLDGAHASLGRAYRALGDLPSAVAVLKEGIERNPNDQESRYVLGQVFMMMGQNDEARREMDAYTRLQEQMTRTNSTFESAVQLAQAGNLDRAEDLLKETLRLAPRYAPALRVLGTILLNRGNTRRALEMLQQAVTANPLNPETYFNLGTAYFRSGKLSEALDMTQRALVLEEDARFYALLGEIYSKMKRKAEAKTAAERAAQLKSQPGYEPADPYASEMRPRDDATTVKEICGYVSER